LCPHTPAPHSFPTRRSSDLAITHGLHLVPPRSQLRQQKGAHLWIIFYTENANFAIGRGHTLPLIPPASPDWRPPARRQRSYPRLDRKSTRLNSSHRTISYAV